MEKTPSPLIAIVAIALCATSLDQGFAQPAERPPIDAYLGALTKDTALAGNCLTIIDKMWHPADAAMLIEIYRFAYRSPNGNAIDKLVRSKTGIRSGDISDYWQWVWANPYDPHPDYAEFKARLYSKIDPLFREYFANPGKPLIRLDEIRWGGVVRDGIPPLKDPKTLSAGEATYLSNEDIVFGVHFNGQSRAYPKRILAWHEMVKDHVGGQSINGVYCTLCGSMIVYDTEHDGKHYELGTSGFLYRSNKLMYDHATKSMWSTIEGKPVLGPLAGKGIQLKTLPVVTSTWGEWKGRHPDTTVLSLDTGHRRDYGEGVAYKNYFNNDRLMFDIPDQYRDKRLKNKDEILALRSANPDATPHALSTSFLKDNPLYHHRFGDKDLVILTDKSGASRDYSADETRFTKWDQSQTLTDEKGNPWTLTEDSLTGPGGTQLPRHPAHRAFWFGWRAVYPGTALVK